MYNIRIKIKEMIDMAKKPIKNAAINVRLSTEDKKRFTEEARGCKMRLSEYVLHILRNKQVTVIEHGEEIAKAMYELNNTLNKCLRYPNIPVNKTREIVANGIIKLNSYMEKVQGEYNVDSKI